MQRGTDINKAADCIRSGGIVAYPTEGVFGLGCDPDNTNTLQRLIDLKQRDDNKGLIIIAASRAQLNPYIATVSDALEEKLSAVWPGPVTWILTAGTHASALLTGNRDTVATRVTSHEAAANLCIACDSAIVSTSANVSGEAAFTEPQTVADCFGDSIDYLLDLPVGNLQGPTPIFDGNTGRQLR